MYKRKSLVTSLALCLGAGLASIAFADGSDSMRVGDMQYGNALDPTGWAAALWPKDPDGFSHLHEGMKRTPSGVLYNYPPLRSADIPDPDSDQWVGYGILQLGYLATSGDDSAEFVRQYADWDEGLVLGLLTLDYYQPSTANFVELRASRLSGNDQFLRLRAGRYGKYKIEAFHHDIPHTVATNAYPFWDGVGSTDLTVPAPLTPGASSVADVAAVAATRPRQTIRLTRTRSGLSLEGTLLKHWTGYAAITNEDRKGTRLWGGPMFFNFPFPSNGGALETVRPIDFRTTDLNAGLRFVGKAWRFNAVYSGSFFRNHKDTLDFESPFALYNVVGTPNVGNIYQGEFSLEPDNDYHNLRLELARSLPKNGDLSFAAAWGTMRQNDDLLAPVTCTGKGGIFIAPPADYTFNCADWNTPAALSTQTANARIDTALVYAKASFRPTRRFGWHAQLRWYKEDNKTNYLSFNPLTGQYGYISENGSQGSVVPGETGIFDPSNPLYWSYNAMIRNVPFAYEDAKLELGADWRVSDSQSLNIVYTFDHNKPEHRERKRLDESRLKLAWNDREFAGGTLRASIEHARRRGDTYNYDPYSAFYAESLPGFVMPDIGLNALTTDAMRKYDMSDRNETKWRAIYIYPIADTATVSATWHGLNDSYDAPVGRHSSRNQGVTLSWDWQPRPETSVGAWLGIDRARIAFSNVADNEGLIGADAGQQDPSLGGPLYPYANQWWENSRDRDYNAGITLGHDFAHRIHFDAAWSWVLTRNRLGWDAASAGAISGTQQAYAGDVPQNFPDTDYRLGTLDLGLSFPLAGRVGMRVFSRTWNGSFFDWHYIGLDPDPIVDHRIYTDRGPNRSFTASVVGVMVNVGL